MRRFFCVALVASVAGWAAGTAQAQEMGLKGIEARVGYVEIDEADAGGTFILSGGIDLGHFTPEMSLEFGVDYWSKSFDVGQHEWNWSNIGFLGNVRYDFIKDATFRPFVFGGVAFCYQSWDVENCESSILSDLCDDSEVEFGVDLGLGADFSSGGGVIPTARAGINSNGGADYYFFQVGVRFPFD